MDNRAMNNGEQVSQADNVGERTYTVSQIARATGIRRQAVHKGLAGIPPGSEVDVSGKPVSAWCFKSLPIDWQLEITRQGVRRGHQNAEAFLATISVLSWRSPVPWDRVPPRDRDKAAKLQRAMIRALEMREDPACEAGLAEAAGLEDFAKEFGYPISDRQWRRLLSRTLDRDGGEENWQRLEIYLDDRAFAAPQISRTVAREEYQHRVLDEAFNLLENRTEPTAEDRQHLWDAVFRHYEEHTGLLTDTPRGNRERRDFKASLISYLFHAFPAQTLCSSLPSLKRRFDEKLSLWRAKGRTPEALQDKRPLSSGRFRQVQFQSDLETIRDRAILHDGNISLAHRLLREEGKLSQEFCAFYPFDVRSAKSEVPGAVRAAVAPMVEMCLPIRRGPWQARMRGPYIQRDWSGVRPADWFCADDVTWNHYFREQLPDGSWRLLRGECLLITDLRTGYPLDFLLIAGHYNGEHIRSLVLRVHDRIGLPRQGFYFERGVWRSRLVVGDRTQGTPIEWRDLENGLASQGLGLTVRHATTPRAKPIEGLLRILQERMRCIPGFIGFNERTEEHEREQELIARASNGDPVALLKFPTQKQWAEQVTEVLQRFARDPQNGEMLQGRSPAEAWAAEVSSHPLRQLPSEARYILSTHRKEVTVQQTGIVLTIRGKRRLYFNQHTGARIGRKVIAFYNLEMPEILTVSDMDRSTYFTVKAFKLPAMGATREQLGEVNKLRRDHMAAAAAIFSGIKHDVVSTITRDNEQSAEVKELGRFHDEQTKKAQAEKTATTRKMRKIREQVAVDGGSIIDVKNPDRVLEGLERARAYREQIEREEAEAALGLRPETNPAAQVDRGES